MYNSQYYTCEQIDERLLQGYLDDYNTQTGQSLTKAQFLTKLGSIFSKEGVIDNTATQIGYYECDTAAGTAAKAITVANYALFAGGSMKVKFANKNTANNATLNINSQGAKALYYQGERASATNSWDANEVVEIYYDGTSYYANNVKGGSGSGVYDVSKEHPTSGPNSDGKFTLEYILNPSNVNELIPVKKRYPGMSIQFVSTSDVKYVQYRLIATSFSTTPSDWQGVDEEPVAGSENLVKSGGVIKTIQESGIAEYENNIIVYSSPQLLIEEITCDKAPIELYVEIIGGTASFVTNASLFTLHYADQWIPLAKVKDNIFYKKLESSVTQRTFGLYIRPNVVSTAGSVQYKVYTNDGVRTFEDLTLGGLKASILNKLPAINVTVEYPLQDGYYTPSQARLAVPLSRRYMGITLIYLVGYRQWVMEQYLTPSIADSNFSNDEFWRRLDFSNFVNIDEAYPLGSGYYTPEQARVTIPVCNRAGGLLITYKTSADTYVIEQSIANIINNDWKKDSNWNTILNEKEIDETISGTVNKSLESFIKTPGEKISSSTITSNAYVKSNGDIASPADGYSVVEFNVTGNRWLYINGRSGAGTACLACAYDTNGNLLRAYQVGKTTNYVDELIELPSKAVTIKVSCQTANLYTYTKKLNYISKNHWSDKTLWWCGTSIPAGSDQTMGSDETVAGNYPTQVGINLACTVINKSVGGSMCRANVRTGDYDGANFSNITSALTMTKAEIEAFITNYDTLKQLPGNSSWPASLSETDITRLRAASFEDRLLPYLDGTYPMPDLFVIDHGHNDFKYKLSDGITTDIGLEPTVANIGGELAEDTYMTANNNEKLELYFGSLSNIPSARKSDFIASLNRNCYIGAMNFIITLILRYNPHARIVLISNYSYDNGAYQVYSPLIPVQKEIADGWAFPLCEVYKYLGYSNHIIPSSKNWFNATYPNVTAVTEDVTVAKAYCPDGVHPHSDITGDANNIYAGIISEFIKKCR